MDLMLLLTSDYYQIDEAGKLSCPVSGCGRSLGNVRARKIHIRAHLLRHLICPGCLHIYSRPYTLKRHSKLSPHCGLLLDSEFGFGRVNCSKVYNLYYLGLLDNPKISDEIFHDIAGRKRGDPLY